MRLVTSLAMLVYFSQISCQKNSNSRLSLDDDYQEADAVDETDPSKNQPLPRPNQNSTRSDGANFRPDPTDGLLDANEPDRSGQADTGPDDLPGVSENPAGVSHMDDILARHGLRGCAQADYRWSDLVAELGIRPCTDSGRGRIDRAKSLQIISGVDSGIITDDNGLRALYEVTKRNCQGRNITLRFTYDESNALCGYEVFVRYDSNKLDALAVAGNGSLLTTVPRELAHDKHSNKVNTASSTILTGRGCLQCHSRVSSDYGIAGADRFWSGLDGVRVNEFSISAIQDPPF